MMSSVQAKQAAPVYMEPGAGESRQVFAETVIYKATTAQTGGSVSVFVINTPPGGGPPLHAHSREDESFYILEGQFTFLVAGKTIKADPGAYLFAPRGVPHTFANLTDAPASMVVFATPGGIESLFDTIHEAVVAGRMTQELAVRLIEAQGIKVVGPTLAEMNRGGSA